MMWLRRAVSVLKRPFAVAIATAIICTAMAAAASAATVTWTSKEDFEGPVAAPTTRTNIDTTSSPGDVKIGIPKDFVTTATITCVTAYNKIYTTGVDRNSISIVNSTTNALVGSLTFPNPVAGVVYNSSNNKLYVGQKNSNKVCVIDVANDTTFHTLDIGTATDGVYAAAYNPTSNKVYLVNAGDVKVTIIDGASDSPLAAVQVTAGATTGAYDASTKNVYLTNKANNYLTVLNGDTDRVVQGTGIDPLYGEIGGTAPGNLGLRYDAAGAGIATSHSVWLSWNADQLEPGRNIQFQVRTAEDAAHLDSATYSGPGGADTWYDLTTTGVTASTEDDRTVTGKIRLPFSYAAAAEIRVRLTYDGITSPVLHEVGLTYAMQISASAGPGGTISPSGDVDVQVGENQTFVITPDAGYHVQDVVVDGISIGSVETYTFTDVRLDHTIAASFAPNFYHLTYTAGPHGTISGNTSQTVPYLGSGTTVTANADVGYHFVSWSDGLKTPSRTDENVTADINVTAYFEINTYTLTYTAGPHGTISGVSPQTVPYGGSGSPVTAVPDPCYHFVSWSDGKTNATRIDSNVTADINVTANFAINTYSITASSGSGGAIHGPGGVVNDSVTVTCGGAATFNIYPNVGSSIVEVRADGATIGTVTSYTFNNVTSNHSIYASFTPPPTPGLVKDWSFDPSPTGYGGSPDKSGNFYFSNQSGYVNVRRLNSSGVVDWTSNTTQYTGGGLVVTDNFGNVYSQSISTGLIYKYTPDATAPALGWPISLPNRATDTGANALTVDNKGYLYVAAAQKTAVIGEKIDYIYKIRTSDGAIVWSAITPFSAMNMSGLVVDSQGMIYITSWANAGSNLVLKYNPFSQETGPAATYSTAVTNIYNYLAIDSSDNIYLLNWTKVFKLDTNLNVQWSRAFSTIYNGTPGSYSSITTDGQNIYLADWKYLTVLDATNAGFKQAVTDVPSASSASDSWLSTDGLGLVYVHSTYNSSMTGQITRYSLH